jgi:hypothetical protein
MIFIGLLESPDQQPLSILTAGQWAKWETGKVKGKFF